MSRAVSLVDIASYLPGEPVTADYFDVQGDGGVEAEQPMFHAPQRRHHVGPAESPMDMAVRAVAPLIERHGTQLLSTIDVVVIHTQLSDPLIGSGSEIAKRLGLSPEWLIDLDNGGCASFLHAMKVARHLLATTTARNALVLNIQNVAGTLFTQERIRPLRQAAIPGDGAAAALLSVSDRSPILEVDVRHLPEHAGDMKLVPDIPRKYWQSGPGQLHIGFSSEDVRTILKRGNELVPEIARSVLDRAGLTTADVDLFVTNQPNRAFLRNWREALDISEAKHADTFDACGNLFGAGVPVTLDQAFDERDLPAGAVILAAAFAHAGDFCGAAVLRWGGRG